MTERGLPIVDGAPACPFVAFEDDRDERASSPDHRHRCFAEAPPAPRALAHQEAYCLSSAFPVCPTFQDWARREAARSRGDGPRPSESAAAIASDQPQRNPPRNWSAPPPWMARDARPDDWESDEAAARPGQGIPEPGRGLSGSYADRVASGTSAGAMGAAAAGAGGSMAADAEEDASEEDASDSPPPREPEPEPPRDAGHDAPERPRERRRDREAPEWERPRPLEVFPTLRARRLPELSVPPILVGVVALALAAAVLFALPGLLGFGSPSAVPTPTPSVAPSSLESLPPTPQPEPTAQLYIVQAGDTMSKIAKKFGVPLGDLIAANQETIPDPDKLQIGDQVIIPVAVPSEIPAAS